MTSSRRWLVVPALLGLAALTAISPSAWRWLPAAVLVGLAALSLRDLVQSQHAVLRNYPLLGHLRYAMEALRPELQQYFIERDHDGRPFNRETRSIVYERAKGTKDQDPFGTELNVYSPGSEHFVHSMAPAATPEARPRVRVGDNAQAYDMDRSRFGGQPRSRKSTVCERGWRWDRRVGSTPLSIAAMR